MKIIHTDYPRSRIGCKVNEREVRDGEYYTCSCCPNSVNKRVDRSMFRYNRVSKKFVLFLDINWPIKEGADGIDATILDGAPYENNS